MPLRDQNSGRHHAHSNAALPSGSQGDDAPSSPPNNGAPSNGQILLSALVDRPILDRLTTSVPSRRPLPTPPLSSAPEPPQNPNAGHDSPDGCTDDPPPRYLSTIPLAAGQHRQDDATDGNVQRATSSSPPDYASGYFGPASHDGHDSWQQMGSDEPHMGQDPSQFTLQPNRRLVPNRLNAPIQVIPQPRRFPHILGSWYRNYWPGANSGRTAHATHPPPTPFLLNQPALPSFTNTDEGKGKEKGTGMGKGKGKGKDVDKEAVTEGLSVVTGSSSVNDGFQLAVNRLLDECRCPRAPNRLHVFPDPYTGPGSSHDLDTRQCIHCSRPVLQLDRRRMVLELCATMTTVFGLDADLDADDHNEQPGGSEIPDN